MVSRPGREPAQALGSIRVSVSSPIGATEELVVCKAVCRPCGAKPDGGPDSRGSRPWLLTSAPAGPAINPPKVSYTHPAPSSEAAFYGVSILLII